MKEQKDCTMCSNWKLYVGCRHRIASLVYESPVGQNRLAEICCYYAERVEKCGAECPECSSICIKPKGHKGEHGHSGGTYTNITDYWSGPEPTAFDKAWEGTRDNYGFMSNCGHTFHKEIYRAGWQARGKADILDAPVL